jgi:hypothetical protein
MSTDEAGLVQALMRQAASNKRKVARERADKVKWEKAQARAEARRKRVEAVRVANDLAERMSLKNVLARMRETTGEVSFPIDPEEYRAIEEAIPKEKRKYGGEDLRVFAKLYKSKLTPLLRSLDRAGLRYRVDDNSEITGYDGEGFPNYRYTKNWSVDIWAKS